MQFTAYGESKTLREWAQDERCQVSEMTLRKNIHAGMSMEQAFQYRRKPGRHFIGAHEDFSGEVEDIELVLSMLSEGAELWVYTMADASRISLIHKDVRHTVSEEIFKSLAERSLVTKTFETDTIKNYELASDSRTRRVP